MGNASALIPSAQPSDVAGISTTAEIQGYIDALAAANRPWRAEWIAHWICDDHATGLADGADADFWRYCGYRQCRELVRRCINARAGNRPDPNEAVTALPGYEHLQSHYIVTRDGDNVGVPLHDLTDEELAAKSQMHRAMGNACHAHAAEIERYVRLRKETA